MNELNLRMTRTPTGGRASTISTVESAFSHMLHECLIFDKQQDQKLSKKSIKRDQEE